MLKFIHDLQNLGLSSYTIFSESPNPKNKHTANNATPNPLKIKPKAKQKIMIWSGRQTFQK
jgi:hypothetical protein